MAGEAPARGAIWRCLEYGDDVAVTAWVGNGGLPIRRHDSYYYLGMVVKGTVWPDNGDLPLGGAAIL